MKLFLCDWLPPDFGAVGQYTLVRCENWAQEGQKVMLVGFCSKAEQQGVISDGNLSIRRVFRPSYNKTNLLMRAWWTLGANVRLIWAARKDWKACDTVYFTGSPPYLMHFVKKAEFFLGRKKLIYRITDFHPECLIAYYQDDGKLIPFWMRWLQKVTQKTRSEIDGFEALGEDQKIRLAESGVDAGKVSILRDPSPVEFTQDIDAAEIPSVISGRKTILYSGNWGQAHDVPTFVDGFSLFCKENPNATGLWLNAVGKNAKLVADELKSRDLPYVHTEPCAIEDLPSVLLAADIHLITLKDTFVGYVLPSKVYACVASGKPVLFIGSEKSDVHLVCQENLEPHLYRRVDVGDVSGVAQAIKQLI